MNPIPPSAVALKQLREKTGPRSGLFSSHPYAEKEDRIVKEIQRLNPKEVIQKGSAASAEVCLALDSLFTIATGEATKKGGDLDAQCKTQRTYFDAIQKGLAEKVRQVPKLDAGRLGPAYQEQVKRQYLEFVKKNVLNAGIIDLNWAKKNYDYLFETFSANKPANVTDQDIHSAIQAAIGEKLGYKGLVAAQKTAKAAPLPAEMEACKTELRNGIGPQIKNGIYGRPVSLKDTFGDYSPYIEDRPAFEQAIQEKTGQFKAIKGQLNTLLGDIEANQTAQDAANAGIAKANAELDTSHNFTANDLFLFANGYKGGDNQIAAPINAPFLRYENLVDQLAQLKQTEIQQLQLRKEAFELDKQRCGQEIEGLKKGLEELHGKHGDLYAKGEAAEKGLPGLYAQKTELRAVPEKDRAQLEQLAKLNAEIEQHEAILPQYRALDNEDLALQTKIQAQEQVKKDRETEYNAGMAAYKGKAAEEQDAVSEQLKELKQTLIPITGKEILLLGDICHLRDKPDLADAGLEGVLKKCMLAEETIAKTGEELEQLQAPRVGMDAFLAKAKTDGFIDAGNNITFDQNIQGFVEGLVTEGRAEQIVALRQKTLHKRLLATEDTIFALNWQKRGEFGDAARHKIESRLEDDSIKVATLRSRVDTLIATGKYADIEKMLDDQFVTHIIIQMGGQFKQAKRVELINTLLTAPAEKQKEKPSERFSKMSPADQQDMAKMLLTMLHNYSLGLEQQRELFRPAAAPARRALDVASLLHRADEDEEDGKRPD